MKQGVMRIVLPLAMLGAAAVPMNATAENTGAFYKGGYVAPMATYMLTEERADEGTDERLDDGLGGTLAFGYRSRFWALELVAYQLGLDAKDDADSSADLTGGALNGLLFPFSSLPNLFAIASIGGAELADYPIVTPLPGRSNTKDRFTLTRAGAGLGALLPLRFGDYQFGIRAEALYVFGWRDKAVNEFGDIDAPRRIDGIVLDVGLQLPFGLSPPPAEPEPEPAAVVPIPDSDGDGVLDDTDECPDTPAGAEVDAVGCPLPPPPPPPPPCKTPEPGERVSLAGCGTGDRIVLRGVNFDFDSARLTANAKTILDQVAEELAAYPDVNVEVGGHTDARGSDSYNLRLSEQRAAAVVDYLTAQGVAAGRMTSSGHGESQPVADNETDEGREQNRRVELTIVAGSATPAESSNDELFPAE